MPSSGMWGRVGPVRTGVSEENVASIVKVERTNEVGTALAVSSNLSFHKCLSLIASQFAYVPHSVVCSRLTGYSSQ
jgi:hypothetical protein